MIRFRKYPADPKVEFMTDVTAFQAFDLNASGAVWACYFDEDPHPLHAAPTDVEDFQRVLLEAGFVRTGPGENRFVRPDAVLSAVPYDPDLNAIRVLMKNRAIRFDLSEDDKGSLRSRWEQFAQTVEERQREGAGWVFELPSYRTLKEMKQSVKRTDDL